jgi:hypothetical protein
MRFPLHVALGFATHIRTSVGGGALARVGWIADALLIAGIPSRLVFVYPCLSRLTRCPTRDRLLD